MNILWITNSKVKINEELKGSGGWLPNTLKLLRDGDLQHSIFNLFPSKENKVYVENDIKYISMKCKNVASYRKKIVHEMYNIISKGIPNVIHIWGTETAFTLMSLDAIERCGLLENTVISIQGIITYIYETEKDIKIPLYYKLGWRPNDIYSRCGILARNNRDRRQSIYEIKAIKKAKNIIGRTDLDKKFVERISPECQYYYCGETLREPFYYTEKWKIENCRRHSIFVSEAHYPLKGLHQVFYAVKLLKLQYPDIELNIAGEDMFVKSKLGKIPWDLVPPFIKRTGYQAYLWKLARKYDIIDNINFTGRLNAEEMIQRYLSSNVFVNASIMENSSNSVAEARILVVPCVTTFAGGMTSQIGLSDGMFCPWNEPWQLASVIARVFDDDELAKRVSNMGTACAKKSCSVKENYYRLVDIYNKIILK